MVVLGRDCLEAAEHVECVHVLALQLPLRFEVLCSVAATIVVIAARLLAKNSIRVLLLVRPLLVQHRSPLHSAALSMNIPSDYACLCCWLYAVPADDLLDLFRVVGRVVLIVGNYRNVGL